MGGGLGDHLEDRLDYVIFKRNMLFNLGLVYQIFQKVGEEYLFIVRYPWLYRFVFFFLSRRHKIRTHWNAYIDSITESRNSIGVA